MFITREVSHTLCDTTKPRIIYGVPTAVVQKTYLTKGFPLVHGWVFDVKTGELIDLHIDFQEKLKDIQEIYNLGASE